MQYLFKLSELNAFIEATHNITFRAVPEVGVMPETLDNVNAMQNIYDKVTELVQWLKDNELYEVD